MTDFPSDPYRSNTLALAPASKPNFLVRAWRAIFGRLIYDGEETCGHCRYWKPVFLKEKQRVFSDFFGTSYNSTVTVLAAKGDCKLIYSEDGQEKKQNETCHRFTAKRKYKRRIR
jgi:hypothetical protein